MAYPYDDLIHFDLYVAFAETAERLKKDGFSSDAILDAALAPALAMSSDLHGPAATSRRLEALRSQFAREAAAIANAH